MKMNSWPWMVALFIVIFFVRSTSGRTQAELKSSEPEVDLCEILNSPKTYSGQSVTVIVRVTSTKEGTSIWSPHCSKKGVRLVIESKTDAGVDELAKALNMRKEAGHPTIATITGIYTLDYYDDLRHRKAPAFRLSAAKDIRESSRVEWR